MSKVRVKAHTVHRKGKVYHVKGYTRSETPRQRAAARRNVVVARKKWMHMSPTAREKAMPARNLHPSHRYPVGTYMMLDVGEKKDHYQYVQKTKYGWKKVEAPRAVRKYQVKGKPGYVVLTTKSGKAMTAPARKRWMHMSHTARAKAMPSWSLARRRKFKHERREHEGGRR